jgi:hypothetical protein
MISGIGTISSVADIVAKAATGNVTLANTQTLTGSA